MDADAGLQQQLQLQQLQLLLNSRPVGRKWLKCVKFRLPADDRVREMLQAGGVLSPLINGQTCAVMVYPENVVSGAALSQCLTRNLMLPPESEMLFMAHGSCGSGPASAGEHQDDPEQPSISGRHSMAPMQLAALTHEVLQLTDESQWESSAFSDLYAEGYELF